MKRLALAGVTLAALMAIGGVAAKTPAWTAQGSVTALHRHSITVHGHTCRLDGAFGGFVFYRWAVGDGAKISCSKGVLLKIAVLPLPAIVITAPTPRPAPTTATPSTASSPPITQFTGGFSGNGSFSVTTTGSMAVSALGSDSITIATGITLPPGSALQSSYTCSIGASSPSVEGLQVGAGVTRFGCQNGVLTSLTRG